MSEVRPSLTPSLSFPGPSSASVAARPPKRRLTSTPELDFFTPAATSFRPRPYTPHSAPVCDSLTRISIPTRNRGRSLDAHALTPAGMDPQPTDANVLFIHPPFTTFPDSHMHPDGLSYQLMADNPEWFLDAEDFVSKHNSNPNVISYPPHLEPPRGWCPAKKKDLKDRGSGGWPEGEEPRLRCTFCRRTYAGVNAKSMWRRHVFEKHKIAMSNRRDGTERPRGRGSNKENRQLSSSRLRDEAHDSLINMDVAPQTEPRNISHKSKFRSVLPVLEDSNSSQSKLPGDNNDAPAPRGPKISQDEFPASMEGDSVARHPLSRSHVPPISPPPTPQTPVSSDLVNTSFETDSGFSTSPALIPIVPPSPYDPLLTPSFRHSPPRLPSDQPWRFPSPSHPLHSRSRELSLSMLIRDLNSPIMKGSSVVGGSPRTMQVSPIPSPRTFGSVGGKRKALDLDTPERVGKLSRPSPRALFSRGQLPVPLVDHMRNETRYRIEESPLHRNSRMTIRNHKQSDIGLTDNWLSEVSLTSSVSSLDSSELLTSGDPFVTMYSSWGSLSANGHEMPQEHPSSTVPTPEVESPVLRNSELPHGVGLGIGLLGPFNLSDDETSLVDGDNDFGRMVMYPPLTEEEGDEAEVAYFLAVSNKGNSTRGSHETPPPSKKRKMTVDDRD